MSANNNSPIIFGPSGATNLTNTIVTGSGDGTGTPAASTVRGTDGVGTDIAGGNLVLRPGNGTGAGGSGNLIIQTAPAAVVAAPAIANPQNSVNTNGTSITAAYTVPATANRVLIVQSIVQNAVNTTGTPTYGGVNMTLLNRTLAGGNAVTQEIWYLVAPAAGSANLIFNYAASTQILLNIYTATGVDQTTPFNTVSSSGSAAVSVSLTPASAVNQTVVDFLALTSNAGVTTTAGQTPIQNTTTGFSVFGFQTQKAGVAGTTTMSYSFGGSTYNFAYVAIAIRPITNTAANTLTEVLRVSPSGALGLSGAVYGSSGQVLTSQGSSLPPAWSTPAASSVKNYLGTVNGVNNNGDFETGAVGNWVLGNATLTSALPTGTPTFGSGAAGTLGLSVVNSGTLQGSFSLSYASSAATTAGNFVSSPTITIDREDQAKVLSFRFYYSPTVNPTNANFSGTSSNSFGVAIWDVANSSWIIPSGVFNLTQGSGVGIATGSFQTPSNATQLRLVVYNANATAGAVTILLDDFFLGPQAQLQAPAMSDWTSTDSASFTVNNCGTVTGQSIWTRRVGDHLEVVGYFVAGTPAAGALSISLPSRYVIASAKLPSATNGTLVGQAQLNASGAGTAFTAASSGVVQVFYDGSTTTGVFVTNQYASNAFSKANASAFVNSGNSLTFKFSVPIQGWSSNTVSSSDTDTRVVAMTATGTVPATSAANPFIYPTVTFDTHGAYNPSTGRYTIPVSGFYRIRSTTAGNPAAFTGANIYRNGTIVQPASGSADSNGYLDAQFFQAFNAGDVIDVRPNNTMSVASSSKNLLSIERLSGPAVVQASEIVTLRYTNTAGTVISGATTIPFATRTYDSHLMWNGTQATAVRTGRIRVTATIQIQALTLATTGNVSLQVNKNGTFYANLGLVIGSGGAGVGYVIKGSETVDVLPGDVLTIVGNSSTTPTLSTGANQNSLCMEYI